MQIKAAREGLRALEVPVSYRLRIGKSKVSGTIKGVIGAGTKILFTIFKAALGLMPESKGQSSAERIIVFTRYPEPGMVKTRLAPILGKQGAAALQQLMSEHIIKRVRDLQRRRHVTLEVRYLGGSLIEMSRWLGHDIEYREQRGSDLGERMTLAFQDAFAQGSTRVLLIGSDCPGISCSLLAQGLDALLHHDVVFGPAVDGGYYLVGMKQSHPSLFSGLTWGTSDVLQQTLDIARSMNLSAFALTKLSDVDRPEDLTVWESAKDLDEGAHAASGAAPPEPPGPPRAEQGGEISTGTKGEFTGISSLLPRVVTRPLRGHRDSISVIIPALNEAETLPGALASIGRSDEVEIIVVDGGSVDETLPVAQSLGAKTIRGPKGRGTQMNSGAAEATGDILLFLHADTRLPAHWADYVRRELSYPDVSGGAFRFRTDSHAWGFRIIEWLANFRATWLQMPYGDQGLFVRAHLLREIGGFPELPVMEDFEFVRQVRRRGRVGIAHAAAQTSSRRWNRSGIWQTSARNQVIILGYLWGISPELLLRVRSPEKDTGS